VRKWVVLAVLAAVAAAGALGGCGIYATSSGRVRDAIRRVAVPYLDNLSAEPGIEIELTEQIIAKLQEDNTLKVVQEKDADSILTGKIVQYRLKEAFATPERRVNEYQVQIVLELDFSVKASGEKIFSKKRFRGTGNYILDDPAGSNETTARQAAVDEIVRDVLASVVEDW
jgi:outer membrane lipopolysaccharide assembly protein LptE/RlpB